MKTSLLNALDQIWSSQWKKFYWHFCTGFEMKMRSSLGGHLMLIREVHCQLILSLQSNFTISTSKIRQLRGIVTWLYWIHFFLRKTTYLQSFVVWALVSHIFCFIISIYRYCCMRVLIFLYINESNEAPPWINIWICIIYWMSKSSCNQNVIQGVFIA